MSYINCCCCAAEEGHTCCPGWFENSETGEIERCDDCWTAGCPHAFASDDEATVAGRAVQAAEAPGLRELVWLAYNGAQAFTRAETLLDTAFETVCTDAGCDPHAYATRVNEIAQTYEIRWVKKGT